MNHAVKTDTYIQTEQIPFLVNNYLDYEDLRFYMEPTREY